MSFVAKVGAVLRKLPQRDIFGGLHNFLSLMSAQEFMSAQNLPKISLHGNCLSTAPPLWLTQVAYEKYLMKLSFSKKDFFDIMYCWRARFD